MSTPQLPKLPACSNEIILPATITLSWSFCCGFTSCTTQPGNNTNRPFFGLTKAPPALGNTRGEHSSDTFT